MTAKNKKHLKITKNRKLLGLGILIVLITAFIVASLLNDSKKSEVVTTPEAQTQSSDIDLSPATAEDIARAEENKKKISDKIDSEKNQTQNPTTNQKQVKPTITYAGQYGDVIEIGGYVDLFEDGGKCTAVFSNGSTSFSKEVNANKGAQSVDCPVMSASVNEFNPKGSWTVVLKYESANSVGTSDSRTIEVN